ncbi:MAG: acyl--CoA ligase [Bacilli bacterium]|nr:acyl--CoA ligase [Bacilli bacterium]
MIKKSNITGYPSIDNPQSKNASFSEKHPIIPGIDTYTILKLLSKNHRDFPAIDSDMLRATYQQLLDDADKLCLAFKELGVKKHDIVTISLPSNYQAIVCFLALNKLGAITTFIDNFSNKEEVISYLNNYESPIFINFNKSPEENKEIKDKTKVSYIITLSNEMTNSRDFDNDYHFTCSDDFIDFNSLGSIAEHKKGSIILPNKGSDDSLILYTSGSTGQPKAVVLTNKNVLAAQMYAGNTSHTENITGTKTMTCVPLRYPYGMVTSLLTSLLWGKEAIMTPGWGSVGSVGYYYMKKPNIIFGSPAVLDLTMKFLPEEMMVPFISHFISGGDFLTVQHADRGYKFFRSRDNDSIIIGNGCGNAETVSIGSTPVGVPLKQSTAGKILVGSTAMIIDKDIPDDKPIEKIDLSDEKKYYEVGELCIAGEHVFKEYFGEPEKTQCAKFVKNGKTFFRTGTLGFIDTDGYFTPTDRKSRFYIRSTGHKVYLDNVQNIINASDARIADCAAVKQPDENELFINKAFVVLEPGVEPSEELKREMLDRLLLPVVTADKTMQLKEYELPKDIIFVDELPRKEGTEKIDYQVLEKRLLEESEDNKSIKR